MTPNRLRCCSSEGPLPRALVAWAWGTTGILATSGSAAAAMDPPRPCAGLAVPASERLEPLRATGAPRAEAPPSFGSTSAETTDVADPAAAGSAVELGPNFIYLPEVSGERACLLGGVGGDALASIVLEAQAPLGLDVDLAVVLTTDPVSCSSIYYSPRKNDVRGIGYRHTRWGESFDHHPQAALQGVVFLNDVPYWEAYPEEFASAFLHEIGHRWLAFPHARVDEAELDLTGREGGHWSYFFDSQGSPLEGNNFAPDEPFTTATPRRATRYSPLDLYLMGALPAEHVGPLRFLTNGQGSGTDCRGGPVHAGSPPQWCEPKTLQGTWLDFGVDAIVAAEGPRLPAAADAPRDLSVAFFVLGGATSSWSLEDCERLVPLLDARVTDFAEATGGRMTLTNSVQNGGSCERLSYGRNTTRRGSGCSIALSRPHRPFGLVAAALAGLWYLCRTRRKRPWTKTLLP